MYYYQNEIEDRKYSRKRTEPKKQRGNRRGRKTKASRDQSINNKSHKT